MYFIQLNLTNGRPVTVNINYITNFFPTSEGKATMVLEGEDSFTVQQTHTEITDLILKCPDAKIFSQSATTLDEIKERTRYPSIRP